MKSERKRERNTLTFHSHADPISSRGAIYKIFPVFYTQFINVEDEKKTAYHKNKFNKNQFNRKSRQQSQSLNPISDI